MLCDIFIKIVYHKMPFTFTATFPLVVKDEFKKVATVASFARFRHLSLRSSRPT